MYCLTQAKNGVSALELKRQLGIGYDAAWRMKHKLLQVMKERDDSHPLMGFIQLDDAYWGGEHHGGKRGRGAEGKTPFVAAVQTDEQGHPIAMRFTKVKSFCKAEIAQWAQRHLHAASIVVSDGLSCFAGVQDSGCEHEVIITGGGPASVTLEEFTWVNTMIGNVKNSIHGTYHAISDKHLPRYLAEFCYRFNRRFKREDMIPRLGYAAVRTSPMPVHGELLATPQLATRRARDNIGAIGMPVMWRDSRGALRVVGHRVAHVHAPYCNNLERY